MTISEDTMRELDEADRKHAELLDQLEIPAYTDRRLNAQWVQRKNADSIEGTTGWTAAAPAQVLELLNVGDAYVLETKGFNEISGWLIGGRWYDRKSDQDLQRRHKQLADQTLRRMAEHVARNRDDWTAREAALPKWMADQIALQRVTTNDFDISPMGWGYTLTVYELAVLYAAIGDDILAGDAHIEDTPEVAAYAREHGTTGFQHQAAIAIARAHRVRHSTETSPATRGRHLVPADSNITLCGEPIATAISPELREYSDDRYTVAPARTTCPRCLAVELPDHPTPEVQP